MEKTRNRRSLKIFYAWQSDLPPKFNRHAIKNSLRLASAKLEEEISTQLGTVVEIIIDDATRDLPGSPHIPTAILEKIQASDVFVADVSTINSEQKDETKKTPNPNVVFELGHAVAHLGWERVLLLINEVHGSVKQLPFDFDRQRASPFKLAAEGIGSQKELTSLLTAAISLIIRKDPPRPRASHFDLAEAKRERDITNLRWVLRSINWSILDEHITTGAKYLNAASANLVEEASDIVSSSSFHLYDQELKAAVMDLVKHWDQSMKYDHYVPLVPSRSYIFTRGHPSDYAREEAHWNYMDEERIKLRGAADVLLSIIREKYPEIDIKAASDAAGKRYSAQMVAMHRRIASAGKSVSASGRISKKSENRNKETKRKKALPRSS